MRFSRLPFQAKLLLSFALVIVLSLVVSHWLIRDAVSQAFDEFSTRSISVQDRIHSRMLSLFEEQLNNRDFVEQVYVSASPVELEEIWEGVDLNAELFNMTIPVNGELITNGEVHIVHSTDLESEEVIDVVIEEGTANRKEIYKFVMDDGTPNGVFFSRLKENVNPLEENFLGIVNGSMWFAGGAVGGIALLLGLGLVRQMTVPLRTLDGAVRQIRQGNRAQRVPFESRDELGRLGQSFNEMAQGLEEAEVTKRQMIADVAHELRTPISVLRSGLEGLMDEVLPANNETYAALHTKTLLVGRLVDDLQQLAMADAGKLSIQTQPIELSQLLNRIQTTIGVELEDQQIDLNVNLPDDLPQADVDMQRIEQVFLNLLSNAARYTPANGEIRIDAEIFEAEWIEVTVCDTGPGFDEDDVAHVFDRFYRADKSRARQSGGSGLGLAIVKALIEAHGGTISASNAVNGGACFRFTLPIAALN
jgi:signal transduction histidine kinase